MASRKTTCVKFAKTCLAAALSLGLAPSAQAAKNWTGSSSGNFSTSGNWGGNNSGRRYFKKENLSGSKVDRIYLSANVTEKSSTGLCFDNVPDRGYWRLRSSTPSNIYTFDNSGNTGTDYDQDLASQHGIVRNPDDLVHESDGAWYYEMQELGFNYRLTDIQSALLISQLNKLQKFSDRRKEIVNKYNEAFKDVPEIIVQKEIPESDTTRHLYVIRLDLDKLKCTRREFFDALSAENVQPQVHYVPVYFFPFYEKRGYKKGLCPEAEKLYNGMMSIPLYPLMTDSDVDDVITAVKKVVEGYKK